MIGRSYCKLQHCETRILSAFLNFDQLHPHWELQFSGDRAESSFAVFQRTERTVPQKKNAFRRSDICLNLVLLGKY